MEVVERTSITRENGRINYYENDAPHELDPRSIVSMNFWGFHPNVFEYAERYFIEFVNNNLDNPKAEFYIPTVANRMLEEGVIKLSVLESEDQWFGITYTEDKPVVEEAFRKLYSTGAYKNPLW